jgi:hypothetical protein
MVQLRAFTVVKIGFLYDTGTNTFFHHSNKSNRTGTEYEDTLFPLTSYANSFHTPFTSTHAIGGGTINLSFFNHCEKNISLKKNEIGHGYTIHFNTRYRRWHHQPIILQQLRKNISLNT